MSRFADCAVSLYEAEIATLVEMTITEVLTVNVALVAPAGTVTVLGTVTAEGLPLEIAT